MILAYAGVVTGCVALYSLVSMHHTLVLIFRVLVDIYGLLVRIDNQHKAEGR